MTDIPNSNLGFHWDKQARGVPIPAGPTASAIFVQVSTAVAAAAAAVAAAAAAAAAVLATAPTTAPIPAGR
ncbi:hypothetical protein PG987_006280 [Apiospora arundinis]